MCRIFSDLLQPCGFLCAKRDAAAFLAAPRRNRIRIVLLTGLLDAAHDRLALFKRPNQNLRLNQPPDLQQTVENRRDARDDRCGVDERERVEHEQQRDDEHHDCADEDREPVIATHAADVERKLDAQHRVDDEQDADDDAEEGDELPGAGDDENAHDPQDNARCEAIAHDGLGVTLIEVAQDGDHAGGNQQSTDHIADEGTGLIGPRDEQDADNHGNNCGDQRRKNTVF